MLIELPPHERLQLPAACTARNKKVMSTTMRYHLLRWRPSARSIGLEEDLEFEPVLVCSE